MASRRPVPASVREALLGIPSHIASLERNDLLRVDYGRVLNDTPSVGVLIRVLSRPSLSTSLG